MYNLYGVLDQVPRHNGRHFVEDVFKCIFLNEEFCFFIPMSLEFVLKDPIDNK